MVWGSQADPKGADFAPRELPPGFADPESAETLAVVMGAPPEPGERGTSAPSSAAAREGVGESSGIHRLSPARREVVRRYFSSARAPGRGRERTLGEPPGGE